MDNSANPWKLTTIAMILVVATALVTAVVTANWSGRGDAPKVEGPAVGFASPSMQPSPTSAIQPQPAPVGVVQPAPAPAQVTRPQPAPAVPTQAAIEACNRYAGDRATTKDKTLEVVKDSAIGGAIGAAVGAAGGAIAAGGGGAGKGAAIGGIVGLGGGALYGLNENKKDDERYRQAYANCMRLRGYAG